MGLGLPIAMDWYSIPVPILGLVLVLGLGLGLGRTWFTWWGWLVGLASISHAEGIFELGPRDWDERRVGMRTSNAKGFGNGVGKQ